MQLGSARPGTTLFRRRGFASALSDPVADRTFVVLDAEPAPGGAWRHRHRSGRRPRRRVRPRHLGDPHRHQRHRHVDQPGPPALPGPGDLRRDPTAHQRLRLRRPVRRPACRRRGRGISALQQLEEISRVATTFWYTRREPVFRDGGFNPEVEGREIIAKVVADVEAGRPTGSVVSYTGLAWTPYALAAKERGALERREMFTSIEPGGVREADGTFTAVDAILWATGFKAALAHLNPLGLRGDRGGIRLVGTQVAGEARVHLIGFGPSQSTVGANRAGRAAVNTLVRNLTDHERWPADWVRTS
jgi:hypothetical protein